MKDLAYKKEFNLLFHFSLYVVVSSTKSKKTEDRFFQTRVIIRLVITRLIRGMFFITMQLHAKTRFQNGRFLRRAITLLPPASQIF